MKRKTMSDILIVATGNAGKLREIRARLALDGSEIKGLHDLDISINIIEDADTFEGNALKKAAAVFEALQLPCLSDDSGLEVDALGGRPGVYSARFGGPDLSDAERCEFLLEQLAQTPDEHRTARFRAVLAYLALDSSPVYFTGTLEGRIAEEPSGIHGFGYDPVFIPEGFDRSLAELGPEIKSRISHRTQALDKFQAYIRPAHAQ